ncbi:MAG: hypothetical protein D6696_04460 [Acidobacteria bacterium]|nr:MAG: hypothetical protein D6696_04460 [Acidobacteriota bacterium]
MARKLRYIPPGGALVEITSRTIQGRLLLRPSRELNETVIGALARAQRKYPIAVCGVAVLSNHYHLLAWVEDAERLARFMAYFNAKLAKEVRRLHGWSDKIWARRYDGVVVSQDEATQVRRLKYVLSQGTKEGLVRSPYDWPGVHCAAALVEGRPLTGFWFDRTAECQARQRGRDDDPYAHATPEMLVFDPLPCWRHLPVKNYRQRVADLVSTIEQEAADDRRQRGTAVLGARAIAAQDPHARPEVLSRSPAPDFHARGESLRLLRRAYSDFVAAFREASARLRAGERDVRFPEGCFPPGQPFVRAGPIRAP